VLEAIELLRPIAPVVEVFEPLELAQMLPRYQLRRDRLEQEDRDLSAEHGRRLKDATGRVGQAINTGE
jgi:hypothetical protein